MNLETWIAQSCPAPSAAHAAAAAARQDQLTKPQGALGRLEKLAIELAALQSTDRPRADNARIVLFAGDHGVVAQGISAYPSAVTVQMLENFAGGGAAISVLARQLGATLEVVDAGTLASTSPIGVVIDRPCCGTRDFAREPAMTPDQTHHALAAGRRAVRRATEQNTDILILGEMGIGNTTSATAIAAALLGKPAHDLAGAGTGLDAGGVKHKADVVDRALELHRLRSSPDALDVLRCVGGLEIAALTGAVISAAQARIPVLIDGFIVTAAALVAVRLNPSCRHWLMFAHRSSENGHAALLSALDAQPLLDLGLRLGEGSGAALALPIVRLACAVHAQMATFAEAGVSGAA